MPQTGTRYEVSDTKKHDVSTNEDNMNRPDGDSDNINKDLSDISGSDKQLDDAESVHVEDANKLRKIQNKAEKSDIHARESYDNNKDEDRSVRLGNTFINITNDNDNDDDVKRSSQKLNSSAGEQFPDAGDAFEKALYRLGPFGFYQRYVLFLLCIPNIFSAMYSLNYVFVADQVPFRCIVSECEGGGDKFANSTVEQLLANDTCRRYAPLQPDRRTCEREHFHPSDTVACDTFLYENTDTIYAEFSLACNEWRRTLVGTVRNAALPLALLLTGCLSDGWGRRTALCVFVGFAGALGIIKSFSPNYVVYLVMEFLEAALGYGFNSAAYVMALELARPSLRAAFACATGVSYGLGGVLFALLASRVRYWRHLLRAIHLPALLLVLYRLLLDESARWLHATGRHQRATDVVKKAAQWNKVLLDEKLTKSISEESYKQEEQKVNPWWSLVKSRVLILRFLVCSWCWVVAAFVYYGLTINSVSLAGDKYVNFALNMAMEIVASLLIVMALERFGRKRSIFVAFLVCGVACVTPFFVSHEGTAVSMFFTGKLAISFAYNSLYVFVAELFPTEVRSSAMAAISLVGRIGSILAPQTPLLSGHVQAILYGVSSASAALLILLAPETRRAPLPPTVAQAERLRAPPYSLAHSRVHSPVATPAVTPSVTPVDTLSRAHNFNTRI